MKCAEAISDPSIAKLATSVHFELGHSVLIQAIFCKSQIRSVRSELPVTTDVALEFNFIKLCTIMFELSCYGFLKISFYLDRNLMKHTE